MFCAAIKLISEKWSHSSKEIIMKEGCSGWRERHRVFRRGEYSQGAGLAWRGRGRAGIQLRLSWPGHTRWHRLQMPGGCDGFEIKGHHAQEELAEL